MINNHVGIENNLNTKITNTKMKKGLGIYDKNMCIKIGRFIKQNLQEQLYLHICSCQDILILILYADLIRVIAIVALVRDVAPGLLLYVSNLSNYREIVIMKPKETKRKLYNLKDVFSTFWGGLKMIPQKHCKQNIHRLKTT